MSSRNHTTLSDWYLARLRHSAKLAENAKLTPRALLETDSALIRELVKSRASQSDKLLLEATDQLRQRHALFWTAERAIYVVAIAGTIILTVLLINGFN